MTEIKQEELYFKRIMTNYFNADANTLNCLF